LQGRYRILSRIASGAMGVVYKGERLQLGRPVAVKFLHPWIAAQKAFIGRFDNEARAMSRLAHPHCVSVIDFGVEGAPYLVMDFVTGRTLREVMDGGRLPVPRTLHIVKQLLAGLAHAHAQGIIHRDLKPENLVLSEEAGLEDHLRILDFGLAKLRDGPAMTAGLAVGTPSYMSPEQTGTAGAIDARTDLYAVGVLLFELLAGRKPFQSDNVGELILMHREAPVPPLREVAPDAGLSAEMEAVASKAMSKFPDERFQSAAEFIAALDATPEAKGEVKPASKPSGPPAGARRAPPAADATIIDSPSVIERIVSGGAVPGGATVADRPAPAPAPAGQGQGGPAQWLRDKRVVYGGVGLVAAVILGAVITRAVRHSTSDEGARASAPASGGPAPAAGAAGPESPRIEEARQLVARGDWEQAVAVLNRLRAEAPDNADAPYMLASIYLDNRRWSDGLAAAQVAVHKNPAFKADADLIRAAIRSLVSDHSYERSQAFLRSLGAPAVPFIKEAAHHDESPKVRERAAEILQGGGGRSAFGRSSSSSSSSSSMFKR
jgi:serine/threonine-protein kinase